MTHFLYSLYIESLKKILLKNSQIQKHNIKINGETADSNHILKLTDKINNKIHRHEFPVTSVTLKKIFEDEKYYVIDKPASIPVHPCGKYKYNSVTEILYETSNQRLYPVHRLDRLTSGVLLFCKTKEIAKDFQKNLDQKTIQKIYLAKVGGDFLGKEKSNSIVAEYRIYQFYKDKRSSYKCLEKDDTRGKQSKTIFQKISYDKNSDSSLVKCTPVTGRTHQIRLHLRELGHPIIDDCLYNKSFIPPSTESLVDKQLQNKFLDFIKDSFCSWCPDCQRITEDSMAYLKELVGEPMELCLRAVCYKLNNEYCFKADIPSWADMFNLTKEQKDVLYGD